MKASLLKEFLTLSLKSNKGNTIPDFDYVYVLEKQIVCYSLNIKVKLQHNFENKNFRVPLDYLKKIVDLLADKADIILTENSVIINGVKQYTFEKTEYSLESSYFKKKFTYEKIFNVRLFTPDIFNLLKYTGNDSLRPIIQQVTFDKEYLFATDGFKLKYIKTNFSTEKEELLQPVYFNKEICSIMPSNEFLFFDFAYASYKVDDDVYSLVLANFKNGNCTITAELPLFDNPINFKSVVPIKDFYKVDPELNITFENAYPVCFKVYINKKLLLNEIKKALVCANKNTYQVIFNIEKNVLTLSSVDLDRNLEYKNEIPCRIRNLGNETPESFAIGFNGNILSFVVGDEELSTVCIELKKCSTAAIISNSLIMPSQIS